MTYLNTPLKELAREIANLWVEYCNEAIADKKHKPFYIRLKKPIKKYLERK